MCEKPLKNYTRASKHWIPRLSSWRVKQGKKTSEKGSCVSTHVLRYITLSHYPVRARTYPKYIIIIIMYPQCIGQCCDARAKQERALFYFIVKGSGCPPHNAISDRSVQYRFGFYIFPFPKSDHQFCGVRRALYCISLPPPRLSCAPI